jgi:hypothetical protein
MITLSRAAQTRRASDSLSERIPGGGLIEQKRHELLASSSN